MFYERGDLSYGLIGVYKAYGKPMSINAEGRKHTALSLRIRGNSRFYCGEEKITAMDGTLAYFPAGVDYRRETLEEEEYIVVHLNVRGEDIKRIETVEGCGEMSRFFETMLKEWTEAKTGYRNRCMAALYGLFSALELRGRREIPSVIASGVAYMESEFRRDGLTVGELAERCHVSETYFRRVYRSTFGRSPVQAIIDMRFRYAEDLLKSGYYSVKQAAIMSGFSDIKYFRTAFKARYGITPNELIRGELPRGRGLCDEDTGEKPRFPSSK